MNGDERFNISIRVLYLDGVGEGDFGGLAQVLKFQKCFRAFPTELKLVNALGPGASFPVANRIAAGNTGRLSNPVDPRNRFGHEFRTQNQAKGSFRDKGNFEILNNAFPGHSGCWLDFRGSGILECSKKERKQQRNCRCGHKSHYAGWGCIRQRGLFDLEPW